MDLFSNVNHLDSTLNLLPCDGVLNDLGIIVDNAAELYHMLLSELSWQPDKVTLFGQTHVTKRQTVLMGEHGLSYRYSGHQRACQPWYEEVLYIKHLVEGELAKIGLFQTFNSCLLNLYPTGMAGMGYHADDEPELGSMPIIASVSLGAIRKFVCKHRQSRQKVEIVLNSGQLIVMHGVMQSYWHHTVTKTKKVKEGRINLTFRTLY